MKKNKLFKLVQALFALLLCAGLFSTLAPTSFASPESHKDLINSVELRPVRTGYQPLDNAVDDIFNSLFTEGMSGYDKIKAIYDFMIVNYGANSPAGSTPQLVGMKYSSSRDESIVRHALYVIENKRGACLQFSSAFVIFARALGFDAYRMYGQTAMAAGGMGEHYWPVLMIDDVPYVFDAQVDSHIAGGGSIRYMRFCMTPQEAKSKFSYSGSIASQIAEHNNFDMPMQKSAEIQSFNLDNEQPFVKDKLGLSLKVANPDNLELLYSFSYFEGRLEDADWLPQWETIALNSEKPESSWTPEHGGYYTLKATIKSKRSLSLMSTETLTVFVDKKDDFTLSSNKSLIMPGSLLTLKMDSNIATEGKLFYDFSYQLNNGSAETLIENSLLDQFSFMPKLSGEYLFTAYVKNEENEELGTASADVTVTSYTKGDADLNGRVSASDARLALRYSANIVDFSDLQLLLCDVNDDGKVGAVDARIILRVSARLESF